MAGAYPDAPSRRMAYDVDGTVVVLGEFNLPLIAVSEAVVAKTNNEERAASIALDDSTSNYFTLIFPEDREVDGMFAVGYATGAAYITVGSLSASADTTNGHDGTWSTILATPVDNFQNTYLDYRDNIESLAVSSRAAVRQVYSRGGLNGGIESFHLYGTISAAQTPDRILFLDTGNGDAEFSKVLDYGDVPRGQTQTRTIKIKNNSGTKFINSLQMTAEDIYLNAGSFFTFSLDNVAFQATLNTIGNLGPGDTKLIYVKQIVTDAETLGLQAGRIRIAHDSLT